jgi:hypothetical protein
MKITHTRCRWTSTKGVEFVPVDYTKYPASEGWTDIRHFEVDLNEYKMDLVISPNSTVPEIARASNVEIAINGPFAYISPTNATPIGYIIKNDKLMHQKTSVPQWIDFILDKSGKPKITQLDPGHIEHIALSFSATSELVRDGKSYVNVHGEDSPKDVYASDRPRTALGVKKDDTLVFVVVDGDASSDAGLRVDELARLMIELGCMSAMNLDGGGSSCLVHNGTEISGNSGERRLGAAITFKPKAKENPFASLPNYKDVRRTIRKHPTLTFPDNGIQAKTDIAIHHSLTKTGSAEAYANFHIDTHGWPGIGYHFVIEQDGTIKHCNDINLRTYHVGDSNDFSVGVCLTGDFRTQKPTEAQEDSLRALHKALVSAMPNYKRTRGHNEFPGYAWKECPEFDYAVVIDPPTSNKEKIMKLINEAKERITKAETLLKGVE